MLCTGCLLMWDKSLFLASVLCTRCYFVYGKFLLFSVLCIGLLLMCDKPLFSCQCSALDAFAGETNLFISFSAPHQILFHVKHTSLVMAIPFQLKCTGHPKLTVQVHYLVLPEFQFTASVISCSFSHSVEQ